MNILPAVIYIIYILCLSLKTFELAVSMLKLSILIGGLPRWRANGKEPAGQCRKRKRCGFNPWVQKIPWRRAWQPTPVFFAWRIPLDREAWLARVHRAV